MNKKQRAQLINRIDLDWPALGAPSKPCKHLIRMFDTEGRWRKEIRKRGVFIVNNRRMVLDRQTYREIAAEAKEMGVTGTYTIYCRIATYTGPGMDIIQIGTEQTT